MYNSIKDSLRAWNQNHGERAKLQHAYLALAVIAIVIAGLLGLLDYHLGQQLTAVAMLALGMFFVNLIAWTLLSGIVLAGLEPKPPVTPASRVTRSTKTAKTARK